MRKERIPFRRINDLANIGKFDLLVFGYRSFRPGQKEIIEAVLAGRDCVGVMPTGAGKSLTYQIPARILGGVTLVISPLIALMKDQVDAMEEVGIRATFLNSSLTAEERRERVRGLREGAFELVYASPEGLEASVGAALSQVEQKTQQLNSGVRFDSKRQRLLLGVRDEIIRANRRKLPEPMQRAAHEMGTERFWARLRRVPMQRLNISIKISTACSFIRKFRIRLKGRSS